MSSPAPSAARRSLASAEAVRPAGWVVRFELPLFLVGLVLAAYLSFHIGNSRVWDVVEYHSYAIGFWTSWPPHLPVEYPPLAVLPFTLSLIPPLWGSAQVFAIWMGLLVVAGYLAFRRLVTPLKASAYVVYLLAAAPATLLVRYDLVPALMVVAAIWLLQRRRFRPVYLLLALGTLLKLFPLALLPVLVIAHWQAGREEGRRPWAEVGRGLALCLGIVVVGFSVALVLDPARGLGALSYAVKRPIQLESVPASLLWVASLVGVPGGPDYSFKSFNYVSPLSAPVLALSSMATVLGCFCVYWRQLRGRLAPGHAAIATLLVVICTAKVFSPQYMIWLVPLVAAVFGFELRWLLLCALTTLVYPILYQTQIHYLHPGIRYEWPLLAGVALRNAVLIYLTATVVFAPAGLAAADRISGAVLRPLKASKQAPPDQPAAAAQPRSAAQPRAGTFDDAV